MHIEPGRGLSANKIARPLLALLHHPRAINLGGGNPVKVGNPIARLGLLAPAEHGNSSSLRHV
jgi:hypothetical protein